MINKITLDNFKAFKHAEIEIKPLTVLVGPNSGGKTSILNSISLIQQTLRGSGTDILKFVDTVNFGDFDDIVHQDSDPKEIKMKFEFDDGTYFNITASKNNDGLYLKEFSCDNGEIDFHLKNLKKNGSAESNYYKSESFTFNIKKNPKLNDFFINNTGMVFYRDSILFAPIVSGSILSEVISEIESTMADMKNETSKPSNTKTLNQSQSTQKITTQKEQMKTRKVKVGYTNLVQLADAVLSLEKSSNLFNRNIKRIFENIIYIGPLRANASPSYQFGHFENVGYRGENAVPMIAENKDLRMVVKDVLMQQNIARDIEILAKSTGKVFEFKLKTDITDTPVNFIHVGFGTSQILPIIVQSIISKENSMVIVEQPETHLHPRIQAEFASFLVDLMKGKTKFIIETHSEYFVERIRTCIMKNPSLSNDVAIYYIEQNKKEKQSKITPILIDSNGIYSCVNDDGTLGHLPEGYLTNMRVDEIFAQMDIASEN